MSSPVAHQKQPETCIFHKENIMLDNLTQRFGKVFKNIRGQSKLTEENIKEALREVRFTLLKRTVALPIVKEFCEPSERACFGSAKWQTIWQLFEQAFFGIVNEELVKVDVQAKQWLEFGCCATCNNFNGGFARCG